MSNILLQSLWFNSQEKIEVSGSQLNSRLSLTEACSYLRVSEDWILFYSDFCGLSKHEDDGEVFFFTEDLDSFGTQIVSDHDFLKELDLTQKEINDLIVNEEFKLIPAKDKSVVGLIRSDLIDFRNKSLGGKFHHIQVPEAPQEEPIPAASEVYSGGDVTIVTPSSTQAESNLSKARKASRKTPASKPELSPQSQESSSDLLVPSGQDSDSIFTLGSEARGFAPGEGSSSGVGLNLDDGSSGTFMLDESIFELEESGAIDRASDSSFEISLEDSSGIANGGDIALDSDMLEDDGSDSFVIPVEDLDALQVEDEGDQVVALDEEVDVNAETVAAPRRRPGSTLLEVEPIGGGDFKEPSTEPSEDGEDYGYPPGGSRSWGSLPVLVLAPSLLGICILGILAFEILGSTIGFSNGSSGSSLILKPLLKLFSPQSADLVN